jgi:glycosyltransferase involved in cell wall biosynthesis
MARKAAERYGIPEPTTIIPLGIPDEPSIPLREDDTVDILYIGRAEQRKGTDILLQALADLLPGAPSMTATFVGTELNTYVSRARHLSDTVHILRTRTGGRFRELGVVSDDGKRSVLSAADWLVVPSRFESFGIVAIEAMREGTPLIVTRGTTLEDIGRRAPGTLLFNHGDRASLQHALQAAISLGPRHKSDNAKNIRQAFQANFSVDRTIDQTERAYVEALCSV